MSAIQHKKVQLVGSAKHNFAEHAPGCLAVAVHVSADKEVQANKARPLSRVGASDLADAWPDLYMGART